MEYWLKILSYNPIKKLTETDDKFLNYRVHRDLLDKKIGSVSYPKELEQVIKKQQKDGAWKYKNKSSIDKYPSINHDLVETYKALRILVGKYELNRNTEVIAKCADYLFSCQTAEGDFRGILGNQYIPYYCGSIAEFLNKAGYENDTRIEKLLNWLIATKQNDGGWVVPLQTVKINKLEDSTYSAKPIKADKSLPSSHLATGMVLRAFATHPEYKNSETAKKAALFLKSRFFKADKYNDRKAPAYWTKFQYPYWWTTLISSLDSLYEIGFTANDTDIDKGLEWLLLNQKEDGLWGTKYDKGNVTKINNENMWVCYAICKILKSYFG